MDDRNTRTVKFITQTAVLLAITLAVQMLGLPQPFTGPAVNAMLLLTCIYVGIAGGVIVGLLTPWIAFLRGILAPPLAPMIPFIMLGNAVLVIVFGLARRFWGKGVAGSAAGIVIGAIVKYLVLSSAVRFLVEVPPKIAVAMQTPQLVTALVGGVAALVIERALNAALRRG
ncbi:MAG: ECF transporter S component [Firmicutes bacterium]|nr:ECF transporter S component [Bacillota bacterium]